MSLTKFSLIFVSIFLLSGMAQASVQEQEQVDEETALVSPAAELVSTEKPAPKSTFLKNALFGARFVQAGLGGYAFASAFSRHNGEMQNDFNFKDVMGIKLVFDAVLLAIDLVPSLRGLMPDVENYFLQVPLVYGYPYGDSYTNKPMAFATASFGLAILSDLGRLVFYKQLRDK